MTQRQDKIVPRFEPEVLRAMETRGKTVLDLAPYALTPLPKEASESKTIWIRRGAIAATAFALAAIGYHKHADENTTYNKTTIERSVLRADIIDSTADPAPSATP